jgi:hypothetical protein
MHRALAAALSVLAVFSVADTARSDEAWTCGAWAPDPTGQCEETRACTRRTCTNANAPETCRNETRMECANPKAAAPPASPPPSMPPPPSPMMPPPAEPPPPISPQPEPQQQPGFPPLGGILPQQTNPGGIGCVAKGSRIFVTNATGDPIPKGTTILWQTFPIALSGRSRLPADLAPGQAMQIAKVPFALQCTAIVQGATPP